MKGIRLLALTVLLLASCQTLPVINSTPPRPVSEASICPSPFLNKPYRLVHAIESKVAGRTQGSIIGITLIDPATRSVSCAILTAEGMVLFEARANPALEVIRALPPFDSGNFAQNMIEDIRLIFLEPEGKIKTKGFSPDGAHICRWQAKNGDWIDVVARNTENMEINRYSADGSLERRVKLDITSGNIYQNIELTAKDTFNYSLVMKLIEAEPLEGDWKKEKDKGSEQ